MLVKSFLVVVAISLTTDEVWSYPSGAPVSVCGSLTPSHSGTSQADDVPGGFYIFTELLENGVNGMYTMGETYSGMYYVISKWLFTFLLYFTVR